MDKLDKAREEICKDCMFGIQIENCRSCIYDVLSPKNSNDGGVMMRNDGFRAAQGAGGDVKK